jgi:hypothetical protein
MPISLRKAQSRRANAQSVIVCRRELYQAIGIGCLPTEITLAILGTYTNCVFLLKVRGSTRELCRLASVDSLWAPVWEAIEAATKVQAKREVLPTPTLVVPYARCALGGRIYSVECWACLEVATVRSQNTEGRTQGQTYAGASRDAGVFGVGGV